MDVDLDGLFQHNTTYDYGDYVYTDDSDPRVGKAVWIPVLYSVVLVVGLLGNALLLAVLAQKRRSWSMSDTFILHLGIADVLMLVTLPFWAAQAAHHSGWCFGVVFCKICGAVFNINFYCGIFLLVCISLDHYLSATHAIQLYSRRKPWFGHISCLSVWLVSLLLTIPDLIYLVAHNDQGQRKTLCVHSYSESGSDSLLWSRVFHHTVGFVLPAAVLIICCSCVLLRLHRSPKGVQRQRAFMVILPLVVVFFGCWAPYNITLIVDTFKNSSKEPHSGLSRSPGVSLKGALMVTSALGCIHACLRPLLYLGLCGNFRKRALAMLRCATVESKSSLLELGVGEEALPHQSHEGEALKQITSVEHPVQLVQG